MILLTAPEIKLLVDAQELLRSKRTHVPSVDEFQVIKALDELRGVLKNSVMAIDV